MSVPATPRIKTPAPFKTPDWERDVSVSVGHVMRHTAPLIRIKDGSANKLTSSDPLDVAGNYRINGTQVVGPRDTGWVADTGTALKTANATYVAGADLTFSSPPTAGEMAALVTRLHAVEAALQLVTQEGKALKDLALLHGLAGE